MVKKNTFSNLAGLRNISIFEIFTKDDRKYCGIPNESDLNIVQQRITASGNLTVDEINTFFKK